MIDKATLDSYRHGVDSGIMKSATPNVVRQLLDEIEVLQRALKLAADELSEGPASWTRQHPTIVYNTLYREVSKESGK